eukprot:119677_1
MSRLLRRLDFYREVDRELVKSTNTGAIVSMICLFTVLYLTVTETSKYQTIDIESKVHVNTPHHYDFNAKIPIFINITIPNVACPIFGVDISDALGRFSFSHDPSKVIMHRLFYYHNTKK